MKNLLKKIQEDPSAVNEAINSIVDIVLEALEYYEDMEDPEDSENFDDLDCDGCDHYDECYGDQEDDSVDNDEKNDNIRSKIDDNDVLITYVNNMPVYGEYWEVIDALPVELRNIITFIDGMVKFGKTNFYHSVKEFLDDSNRLSTRIRPSRGNLTAPGFRNLVSVWRANMINDAKTRNGIDLNI